MYTAGETPQNSLAVPANLELTCDPAITPAASTQKKLKCMSTGKRPHKRSWQHYSKHLWGGHSPCLPMDKQTGLSISGYDTQLWNGIKHWHMLQLGWTTANHSLYECIYRKCPGQAIQRQKFISGCLGRGEGGYKENVGLPSREMECSETADSWTVLWMHKNHCAVQAEWVNYMVHSLHQ